MRLRRPNEIKNAQIDAALTYYMGRGSGDLLNPATAFLRDPDQRVQRVGISVDRNWEGDHFRPGRHATAKQLEELRQRCIELRITYNHQVGAERESQEQQCIEFYERYSDTLSEATRKELMAFTASPAFATIPILRVEAHLYATILTRMAKRHIQPGDATDIEALSAYAPYMDVIGTDAFMAEQFRSFAKEFGVKVFHCRTSSLREMKDFLEQYLKSATPVHRPSITAFVLPPKEGRNESFQFFRHLGAATRAIGMNEYVEVYAFDDGAMPQGELRQLPGEPIPFYGLQDVTRIALPRGTTAEEVLNICRKRCRSDHFVLIDAYKVLPKSFLLEVAMCASRGLDSAHGYRIFTKHIQEASLAAEVNSIPPSTSPTNTRHNSDE